MQEFEKMSKLKFFSEGFYYGWNCVFIVLMACYCPYYKFLIWGLNIVYFVWMVDGLWWVVERYKASEGDSHDQKVKRMWWWREDIDAFGLPLTLWLCCVFPFILNLFDIWYF